jgi:hypothetical protein
MAVTAVSGGRADPSPKFHTRLSMVALATAVALPVKVTSPLVPTIVLMGMLGLDGLIKDD